jgi:hypothetical protein
MNNSIKSVVSVVCFLFLAACPKPCASDGECDDGLFCNGRETCGVDKVCKTNLTVSDGLGMTQLPDCSDGIACTVDKCSEERRLCVHTPPDVDKDNHGDVACEDARGQPLGDDCDDSSRDVYPGQLEVCDAAGRDEDCDTATNGAVDRDLDGYISSMCFNRIKDGGVANRGTDCNDTNEGVHPGSLEVCNAADENCNGMIDEGVLVSRFNDTDGDGWGAGASRMACVTEPGTSHLGTDCDDTNPALHPGQFRCVPGGQGTDYSLCLLDGGAMVSKCLTRCIPQPNGTAVCN